jgi:hypothetical protein
MDVYSIPTILKSNFPFFRMIFNFAKTGPAVSYIDSRLSALRAGRRLMKRSKNGSHFRADVRRKAAPVIDRTRAL